MQLNFDDLPQREPEESEEQRYSVSQIVHQASRLVEAAFGDSGSRASSPTSPPPPRGTSTSRSRISAPSSRWCSSAVDARRLRFSLEDGAAAALPRQAGHLRRPGALPAHRAERRARRGSGPCSWPSSSSSASSSARGCSIPSTRSPLPAPAARHRRGDLSHRRRAARHPPGAAQPLPGAGGGLPDGGPGEPRRPASWCGPGAGPSGSARRRPDDRRPGRREPRGSVGLQHRGAWRGRSSRPGPR